MSLMVQVKTNLPNVANGWYEVEFTGDRIFLRRPGDLDAVTILIGSTAICEPPGTVRVTRDSHELVLTVSWMQSQRQRVAADLAHFISGQAPVPVSNVDENNKPGYLMGLAFLPLLIAVIANGKIGPSVIGVGLTGVCFWIASSEAQSVERRLTKILVISLTSIAAYILLVAYMLYHLRQLELRY